MIKIKNNNRLQKMQQQSQHKVSQNLLIHQKRECYKTPIKQIKRSLKNSQIQMILLRNMSMI